MQGLLQLFPANDFALLALILGLPLLGAFANGVFGKRLGKEAVTLTALSAVGIPFIFCVVSFFMLIEVQQGEQAARFTWNAWHWLDLSARGFDIPIQVQFSIDALSGTMSLIVTGIGFLIHLYSWKYMEDDPAYHRFFSYLNLFIFSMLVLILGDNLPVLFVGWEGVGLCSYLLIGFWYSEEANAQAGKKAFITNRIGDFGLLVAMGLLVYYVGALDWTGIEQRRMGLNTPVQVWPIGTHVPIAALLPETWAETINTHVHINAATLVALFLFLGCAGKSAQIPLYVWLPDAMAGPTPVSALIHAATMVTAGVYLVCRMSAVFVLSPAAMFLMAIVGALTALLAATIAVVQHDIKKVLAYSTVSQLGYMFMGVGVGAFVGGFYHVLTHAFFKACLFLGAGSVIHAMHSRIHSTDASQDMRNMGGMRRYMKHTYWTFIAATAAIAGFPLLSGFFSKDEILLRAYTRRIVDVTGAASPFEWPEWGGPLIFTIGAITAGLTAFYMTRLAIRIFYGDFKGWTVVKGYRAVDHGHHDDAHHGDHREEPGKAMEGPRPHESPWQMTVPLMVLAVLALIGGAINPHAIHDFVHIAPLADWLDPVFAPAATAVQDLDNAKELEHWLLVPGLVAFIVGAGAAVWVYHSRRGEPTRRLREQAPGLYALVYDKWRVDELYRETAIGLVDALADIAVWLDRWVVDGILARLTSGVVAAAGWLLRRLQTGRVQVYATVMVLGLGAFAYWVIVPQPVVASADEDHVNGRYTVTAAPGFGYSYRWDEDGDGEFDSEEFGSQRTISFSLDAEERREVKLQVRNAFNYARTRVLEFHRPPLEPGPTAMGRAPQGGQQ